MQAKPLASILSAYIDELSGLRSAANTEPSAVLNLLNKLTKNFILQDDHPTNHALASSAFEKLNRDILQVILSRNLLEDSELEVQYKAYLKMLLVKTSSRLALPLCRVIFGFLSEHLDLEEGWQPSLFKLLSFLHVLLASGTSMDRSRCFSFLEGPDSGLRLHPDSKNKFFRPELTRDFSLVIAFCGELICQDPKETRTLFSHGDERGKSGFSLCVRGTALFLTYFLNIKLMSVATELLLFQDIQTITYNKWCVLSLTCKYNAPQKSSNLNVLLNDRFFSSNIPLAHYVAFHLSTELRIFNNINGTLSLICLMSKAVDVDKIRRLKASVFSQGAINVRAYEFFNNTFEEEVKGGNIEILVTGLSRQEKQELSEPTTARGLQSEKAESFVVDQSKGIQLDVDQDCFVVEVNPISNDLALSSFDVFASVLSLFNYVKTHAEFEKLMKLSISLFSHERLLQLHLNFLNRDPFLDLLSAILCSNTALFFNNTSVESFVSLIQLQSANLAARFLNDCALNFTVLDRFFRSEVTVRTAFELIQRQLDRNSSLSKLTNLKNLQDSLILLLYSRTYVNALKAAQLARLSLLLAPTSPEAESLDLKPTFLYFLTLKGGSLEHLNATISALLSLIKLNNSKLSHKKLFLSALGSILSSTNSAAIVGKTLKLFLSAEGGTDELFLSFWRNRTAHGREAVESTREHYWAILNKGNRMAQTEKLTSKLLRLVFELRKGEGFFHDRMKLLPNGRFNLFFELSLSLEEGCLEKLLQAFSISSKQFPKDFSAAICETTFLVWTTCVAVFGYARKKVCPLFDLSSKLLTNLIAERLSISEDPTIFIQFLELVAHFVNKRQQFLASEALILGVTKELFNKQILPLDETVQKVLVAFSFKFYFSCLANCPKEDLWAESVGFFMHWLAKIGGQKMGATWPLILLKRKASSKNSKPNSSGLSLKQTKGAPTQSFLHLLVSLVLDVTHSFAKIGKNESLSAGLRVLGEIFYSISLVLEKNRAKLSTQKVDLLEAVMFQILVFTAQHRRPGSYLKELREGIFHFNDGTAFPSSFASKMFALVPEQDFYVQTIDERFEQLLERMKSSGRSSLETFFGQERDAYLASCLAEYKDFLAKSDFLRDFGVFSHSAWEKYSQLRTKVQDEYAATFSNYINARYVDEKIYVYALRSRFNKIYKSQRVRGSSLFPAKYEHLFQSFDEFSYDSVAYDEQRHKILKVKQSKIMTSELQRPFMKLKLRDFWKPLENKLAEEYLDAVSFENYFASKGVTFFAVEKVNQLTFIPGFLSLNKTENVLTFLVDFQKEYRESGVELIFFRPKPFKRVLYQWNLSEIGTTLEYKFLQKRIALQLWTDDRECLLFIFKERNQLEEFAHILWETQRISKANSIDSVRA